MSHFEDFERTYGPPESCQAVTDDAVQVYQGKLPPELLDLWREAGRCAYGKRLLWVVDPRQFEDIVDEWVEFTPGTTFVFLRTAFAHLYLWHDGNVYSLDVHSGSLSQVTRNIARMFTLTCDPAIQEKILRRPLYEHVLPRLGPPERDECYGFEPALALGGPGTPETLKCVKIREHLAILKQIVMGE